MNAHADIPPRPSIPPFTGLPDLPAIARLRGRKQWLCWDFELRGKKWTKPPLSPHTGGAGSSTDPTTWASYDVAALKAAKSGFAGVGFALAPDDDTTGIDLDKCRNEETGALDRWAAEIVALAETYGEVSPSGTGIRLFAAGKIEKTVKLDPAHVEMYAGGRYLTVTGHHIEGTPTEIRQAPRTIEALLKRVETVRSRIEREKGEKARTDGSSRPSASSSAGGDTFWRKVNNAALADLGSWVPALFGSAAHFAPNTGAYRVTSRSLRRNLEEDLSIMPTGIVDFGVADMGDPRDGKRTAIDLVAEYENCAKPADAALWLCDRLGVKPEDLGWNARKEEAPGAEQPKDAPRGRLITWYGDTDPEPPRYLVKGLLPQLQTAIVSGQFSAGKTTICSDLAYSVMTGEPFAGHDVVRSGGVLWLGAEGASEVDVRLKATALHRSQNDMQGKLPFARQSFEVPILTDADALPKLVALATETKAGLAERFPETELVLIIVDTLASAAAFQDENSASETQKVMTTLRQLADATGALVLVVDHHGKATETGVRGSSAKSGAADAILAALADKSIEGEISNRRLAIVKLRSGMTGKTIPFSLKPIQVDVWGNTSCGVEWQTSGDQAEQKTEPKPAWSGNARVFKAAMMAVMDQAEDYRPFGTEGPTVRAVPVDRVKSEFKARYPAETPEAKQMAFKRFLKDAVTRELVGSRERGGVDWIWFVKDDETASEAFAAQMKKTSTTPNKPNSP